ncbi:hypothetical protein CDAR_379561 [Caerostris darwini]|uniref:Uncharacterized protein n=1 Tax=Caerostris darwini TaxID=1538125 RepID=A0AAV4RMK6_9ARAC|nr:hypothetical protein CDAR_379561 [Caerostris darwini]
MERAASQPPLRTAAGADGWERKIYTRGFFSPSFAKRSQRVVGKRSAQIAREHKRGLQTPTPSGLMTRWLLYKDTSYSAYLCVYGSSWFLNMAAVSVLLS